MAVRSVRSAVVDGLVFKKIVKEEDANVAGAKGVYMAYTQVSITPAAVGANTCAEQTFTLAELADLDVNDYVDVVPVSGTGNATSMGGVRVSAAGVIAIKFCNPTAGALTPSASTYIIQAMRVG